MAAATKWAGRSSPRRAYLLLVAERRLPPELKAKEGASDLVQETLLEAQRGFGHFEGRTAADLRAWLRRLLLNKVAHAARRYRGTEKRRLARELSLETDLDGEARGRVLAAHDTSPGGRAARREQEASLHRPWSGSRSGCVRPSSGGTTKVAASMRSVGGWAAPTSRPASSGSEPSRNSSASCRRMASRMGTDGRNGEPTKKGPGRAP